MSEPVFIQSTRKGAKTIAHRTVPGGSWTPLQGYGSQKYLAACGAVFTDPIAVDVETTDDFCEPCLFNGFDHVVYTYLDADGSPVYVGQTSNLLKRMDSHARYSAWWPLVADVKVDLVSPEDALRIEASRILALDPPYNKTPRRSAA